MNDIAQHFTVYPNGKIVTGRSLNSNPAGITGWNSGAICVEIYGNFDNIKLGVTTINDIYLGNTKIKKVYIGETLVFKN